MKNFVRIISINGIVIRAAIVQNFENGNKIFFSVVGYMKINNAKNLR